MVRGMVRKSGLIGVASAVCFCTFFPIAATAEFAANWVVCDITNFQIGNGVPEALPEFERLEFVYGIGDPGNIYDGSLAIISQEASVSPSDVVIMTNRISWNQSLFVRNLNNYYNVNVVYSPPRLSFIVPVSAGIWHMYLGTCNETQY